MIDGHSVLGVILARGGSKGLPRKNIRDLAGKPLISWTIKAGHESEYLDRLILSSDDEEIMAIAEEYGCEVPFQRPSELAEDDTPSVDALLHALGQVEPHDYVVQLQPTSPLRTADDIDAAIGRCEEKAAPACVTVTRTDTPPQWMYTLTDDQRLQPILEGGDEITRRQDAPNTYATNGAVYVARTSWFQKKKTFKTSRTLAYPMPKHSSVDIDDKVDLVLAEGLINKNYRE